MDSWTDAQLAMMKMGGNDKCNDYLQKHGIAPRAPIKQKYESPVAQLYKAILKARVEGKPEPTSLPPPPPPRSGNHSHVSSSSSSNNAAMDPNGMERLSGESEQQYVARQTRLREEARARMAAKFGNGTGSTNRSGMQGMGSDPSYNPRSGYNSNSDVLNSFSSGLGAALGVAGSYAGSVAAKLQSEDALQSVKTVGSSFWGTLSSSVSTVAATLTEDSNHEDGLSDLQRQFASQKPTQSKYAGFGSTASTGSTSPNPAPSSFSASTTVQEAPGLPGEDRNGVERLTGESDEQYVVRQTRLRDEARARMAAKFGGGGGLSSVASSPPPSSSRTPPPPPLPSKTPPPQTNVNANDFFSSFGA